MTMHDGELAVDEALVSHLVATQFPAWGNLPVRAVPSGGTVNALFRIGDDLVARLPLKEEWAPDLDHEFTWIPRLAAQLPLEIPDPVARGEATERFPAQWAVYTWIEGRMADPEIVADKPAAARDLAGFVTALHAIDTAGAPRHTYRGLPIQRADPSTSRAIGEVSPWHDIERVAEIWEAAQATPPWQRDPVWVHGDLWWSNLLVDHTRRLVGVIDCGGFGIGDPAIDLIPAWSLLDSPSRTLFRELVDVDDATWARARGWAVNMAVLAIPYYAGTNEVITLNAHRMLSELLLED